MGHDWKRRSGPKSKGSRNPKDSRRWRRGGKPSRARIGIEGIDEVPPEPYVPMPQIPRGDLWIV